MTHYTVTLPVTGRDSVQRYPRVGVMFENHNRETGEVYYTIKLDFPMGATELVAFPPRSKEADAVEDAAEDVAEDVADAAAEAGR